MRAHALAFVKSGMLVSKLDVETYYPTLDIDILELNLVAWGCDRWATETLCDILAYWNANGRYTRYSNRTRRMRCSWKRLPLANGSPARGP